VLYGVLAANVAVNLGCRSYITAVSDIYQVAVQQDAIIASIELIT
jgi:hypothetical protein